MLPTRRSGVQIALSPREIEQWPKTASARALAYGWPTRQPASFRVPTLERAVPVCRHLTRLWMDSEDITDESARGAALLVISELMTNAIVHTSSISITSRLRKTGDWLLVEVRDEGGATSAPRPHDADYANEHGRGLVLIAQSVQALGTRLESDGGRTFWARISLTG
ncbi:Histidine kinase-, DNA gyrase B-, and HSP90-like ATPase [Streptomyces sp. ADI92-24]|nr:Histidine kinase-, DNA gyrase B-, and HSP90-like ATPase [Streptomyces sp. ADI92-24]